MRDNRGRIPDGFWLHLVPAFSGFCRIRENPRSVIVTWSHTEKGL
jgi:hypothetical protein